MVLVLIEMTEMFDAELEDSGNPLRRPAKPIKDGIPELVDSL